MSCVADTVPLSLLPCARPLPSSLVFHSVAPFLPRQDLHFAFGGGARELCSMHALAFPDVSARLIVQPGASGAVVLLTTRVVRRPLSAPTVDDDAALAQRLQCEEEECAAAESAQTESDAVLARELAGVLPSAESAQAESDEERQQDAAVDPDSEAEA